MKGLGNSINGTHTRPIRSRIVDKELLNPSVPMNGWPMINPPLRGMLIMVFIIDGA